MAVRAGCIFSIFIYIYTVYLNTYFFFPSASLRPPLFISGLFSVVLVRGSADSSNLPIFHPFKDEAPPPTHLFVRAFFFFFFFFSNDFNRWGSSIRAEAPKRRRPPPLSPFFFFHYHHIQSHRGRAAAAAAAAAAATVAFPRSQITLTYLGHSRLVRERRLDKGLKCGPYAACMVNGPVKEKR